MADKFEFKGVSESLQVCGVQSRRKSSLNEYKSVIIELQAFAEQVCAENDRLKADIEALKIKNYELDELLKGKQSEAGSLAIKLQQAQKVIEQLRSNLGQTTQRNSFVSQQMNALTNENRLLFQNLQKQSEKRKYFQNLNEVNLQKIRMLEQSLGNAIEQNKQYGQQLSREKSLNEWKIRDLRQFSENLRKKQEIMQACTVPYSHLQQYSEDPTSSSARKQHNEYDLRLRRSFSTEKKIRKNVGCFSTNPQLISAKGRKNTFNSFQNQQPVKPFTVLANPELGQQLQNLKKEIAHQYTLIGLKSETYSRQKVSHTLEQLKKKMTRVVESAHREDESFCLN